MSHNRIRIMLSAILSLMFSLNVTALKFASTHRILPLANFQHDIFFSGDESLETSSRIPENLPLELKTSLLADIGFQPAGNSFHTPATYAVNLFTPNTVQQPAETPGQLENYRKALQEEANETEREINSITTDRNFFETPETPLFGGRKSYVSVRVRGGSKIYDYGYSI